ncbi:class I SAM-dependent methyltransferase [Tsukamurella sp. 8F]|uniref:class I SAM-dependent methyltransferase n=1 Tax=unclassified Tsukamurella TaxID=2633480 RepID=UPI0023B8E4EA|nr:MULTISPECIES: class I SAM-dependent methyltransferase [unclassified Tsukamurella]MDF0528305.1 class I SAM-dependent methyltransferase [Tsukamurella sp. 8J]MDF0589503.1 class I SAM-dependent methyltransferase [Tsukamurella sp. 8F]
MQSPVVAAVYERVWRPAFTRLFSLGGGGTAELHDALLADLALEGETTLLDVGCGPGLYTRRLASGLRGDGLAVGVDLSAPMLRRAAADNSGSHIAYVRASALDLPFPDGAFGTVVCLAALYLIPDPERAVREMCRTAAHDGEVVVFTSLRTPLSSLPFAERALAAGGYRLFGRHEVTGWLRAEGLTAIEQKLSGQGQFIRARRA